MRTYPTFSAEQRDEVYRQLTSASALFQEFCDSDKLTLDKDIADCTRDWTRGRVSAYGLVAQHLLNMASQYEPLEEASE